MSFLDSKIARKIWIHSLRLEYAYKWVRRFSAQQADVSGAVTRWQNEALSAMCGICRPIRGWWFLVFIVLWLWPLIKLTINIYQAVYLNILCDHVNNSFIIFFMNMLWNPPIFLWRQPCSLCFVHTWPVWWTHWDTTVLPQAYRIN